MSKYLFISGPAIEWNLSISSPKKIKLKSTLGLELLNPFHFGIAYNKAEYLKGERITLFKNSVHISTSGLILKIKSTSFEEEVEKVWTQLIRFLKYLRYTSQQFRIKCEGSIFSMRYELAIKEGQLNTSIRPSEMMMRQDYWNSMVTWQDLKVAEKLAGNNFDIPVFEEILLDAINDLNNEENRKAVLYSAIAVESMLAKTYDDHYKKMINKPQKKGKYRFIQQNGAQRDPVYEALTDRTDFKKLLHEIPLYLFNKSLLQSNEKLYAETIKLYTTRNKISHWGAPINSKSDKVFAINQDNANRAVGIAIEIFEWLGNNKFSSLKKSHFVKI